MQYIRAKTPGATYFFTLVTHHLRPIFCQSENIDLLRDTFRYVMKQHPLKIDAIAFELSSVIYYSQQKRDE